MTPKELNTLFAIINVLYSLDNRPVYPTELLMLYNCINTKLGKRTWEHLREYTDQMDPIDISNSEVSIYRSSIKQLEGEMNPQKVKPTMLRMKEIP